MDLPTPGAPIRETAVPNMALILAAARTWWNRCTVFGTERLVPVNAVKVPAAGVTPPITTPSIGVVGEMLPVKVPAKIILPSLVTLNFDTPLAWKFRKSAAEPAPVAGSLGPA